MAKIVYNVCYGGFGLSDEAIHRYSEILGLGLIKREDNGMWDLPDGEWFEHRDFERHDHALVQVVEEMGKDSWGECAELHIREVPDGSLYRIEEYDGFESVILESEQMWETAI